MKTEEKKEFHAVEYMREQKERINKIIKDMSFEEVRDYLDKSLGSVSKDSPLYSIIHSPDQPAVSEPKTDYNIFFN